MEELTVDIDNPKCTVCGKPATHAVRDIQEIEPEKGWCKFRVHDNPIRFGCQDHPQISKTYYLNKDSPAGVSVRYK